MRTPVLLNCRLYAELTLSECVFILCDSTLCFRCVIICQFTSLCATLLCVLLYSTLFHIVLLMFASFQLTEFNITLFWVTSFMFILFHVTSLDFASLHSAPRYFILLYCTLACPTSFWFTPPYFILINCTLSCPTSLYCILYYFTSRYFSLLHVMPWYVTAHWLHCVTLLYSTCLTLSCHDVISFAVLCFTFF